ncbi:lipid droplet assembly factor 1-A [Astyanax mexicanus]|uniref:lipid droplet assembly factor 1-A n=1 Tax=Astyanax mexicanus TaxID=7994 RepID=UPI000BBDCD32|nr:lipid droplet assembly factor 1-A [Astyanax mexicanus]
MENLHCDPRVEELLNTKLGKYLSEHPFLAVVLLVFGVTSALPIGLFLIFAAVTSIAVTVSFVFVEVFLLLIAGTTLLCVLVCLVVVAFWVSCVLSASYIIISHGLNYFSIRMPEQTISAEETETKEN